MPKPKTKLNVNEIRLAICATRGGWQRRRAHELLNLWHSMSPAEREKATATVDAWGDDKRKRIESKLASLDALEPAAAKPKPAKPAAADDKPAK